LVFSVTLSVALVISRGDPDDDSRLIEHESDPVSSNKG